jgi:two-component system, NarL family, sensor histidine kinase UhpB
MKPLSILLLEDSAVDATIIQKLLARGGIQFLCTVVTTGEQYQDSLAEHSYDIILSDNQLPCYNAIKALEERNRLNSLTPFILITGTISEELAILLLQQGADDYILKDRMQRLPFAVKNALEKHQLEKQSEHSMASPGLLTERLHLAAKASFDIIWDYDIRQQTIYCSNAIEKIIGHSHTNVFNPAALKGFIHPDDVLKIRNSFIEMKKSREHRWRKLFRMIRHDGTVAYINNNAFVLRDQKDKAIRVVGVMQDVTELRRLQHELVEQETQKQKQITETSIRAQEKERTEIGQELHDNVNQLLATAKIMIDTAMSTPEMHDVCLQKSQESILEAIKELRHLSHSLMPPSFDRTSFTTSISNLAFTLNLSGQLNIELLLPDEEEMPDMNNEVKLALYRIIQEQLTNILKYAKASQVIIALTKDGEKIRLMITDDGKGFDPSLQSKGIGLKNMQSRIRLFGGTLDVISAPGEGCVLKVSVSVQNGIRVTDT